MLPKKMGFTLIELLVVVLIIGILAAVALPQYQFAVEKAHLSEALAFTATLEHAVDAWLLEYGGFPTEKTFLGDNANGKGQLVLALNGLDCSINGGYECGHKNFSYSASCDKYACQIKALRLINGNRDKVPYVISFYKLSLHNLWQGDECSYFPEEGKMGEKICKMLENQGNGHYACEGC